MSGRSPRRIVLLSCLVLVGGSLACAELETVDWQSVLEAGRPLSQTEVAAGLREALSVGTRRASENLSAPGGFGLDPVLRLELPESVQPLARALRTVGAGAQVDRLEDAMNQAAERAAGEAFDVFATAISGMTISDAFQILNGPDDAATVYFRDRTSEPLRERFSPVVASAMDRVGVYSLYRDLTRTWASLPVPKPALPSLEDYVVDRTLAGLFTRLAEEEAEIRRDPAARTTALLRRVFSSVGQGSAAGR